MASILLGPVPESESQTLTSREEELPPFAGDGGGSSSRAPEGSPSQETLNETENDEPLKPGEIQTFEYNHQSRIPVLGGPPVEDEFQRREVQVFDYNHQPMPWPPGARMGPPPPFPPDPNWRPPGPPHSEMPPPPDLRPPPELPPPIPYFDLPAGLMAPLVPVSCGCGQESAGCSAGHVCTLCVSSLFLPSPRQLHEHSYRTLNPMAVRLPLPQPPTDRLLKAVEEFYEPPSDSKPRSKYVSSNQPTEYLVLGARQQGFIYIEGGGGGGGLGFPPPPQHFEVDIFLVY